MIPADQLISVFRTIIGWPYASPGSNDARGIDCSGAFVYAYRQFGERIYHGSNRIIRAYCHDVVTLDSATRLVPGMAIFKSRADLDGMKAEYKPGGKYYDPSLPYDYYHVGLVANTEPLQIINATTPVARIDTVLSKWCCAGYLNAVRYDAAPEPTCTCPCPCDEAGGAAFPATVFALSGSTVNLRAGPDKAAAILTRVPLGETVMVTEQTDNAWWRVTYQAFNGYMMREFLAVG